MVDQIASGAGHRVLTRSGEAPASGRSAVRRRLVHPNAGLIAGLLETGRFAGAGILANRLRSVLTMLGIMIGVASVITLVAVGTGSNQAVAASIARLGSATLIVSPMPLGNGGHGSVFQQRVRRALGIKAKPNNGTVTRPAVLSLADTAALRAAPDVALAAPKWIVHNVVAQQGGSSHTVGFFVGTSPDYLSIEDLSVTAGRVFTEADYAAHRRLALLGTSVASDLISGDESGLVGKQVRFNGQPFTVAGILAPKGYSGQQDLDDRVVAVGTAVQDTLYGYDPQGNGEINSISLEATSPATLPAAQNEVQTILDDRHHVSAADTDVVVFNAAAILQASSAANRTLTILLGAVAGISLLVGGIGVMNIMLVSVSERTREIGIRKAIGAQRRDIIGQFLGEAVMLSMVGGIIGVAVGYAVSRVRIAGVQPVIAPWSMYMAVGVSLFTGLFFGAYPASRAAALRPIDALRYE